MHLVLANQWYPPESGWGGVAMWNYAMARAYRSLGHAVTVIAARDSNAIPTNQEIDGIQVRRLLVHNRYRWRRLPMIGRYVRPAQQLAYARRVDRALRELHQERPIDAVEFAEVNAEGFFYARKPLTPLIVRCHTPTFVLRRYYDKREMPYDTRIISWCEKDLIRRAHALTAPSRDIAQTIAKECNVPVEEITVIPNALASDEWRVARCEDQPADYLTPRQSDYLTVLHVGRLERVKGVQVLVDAIPSIVKRVPKTRFVFIGDDLRTARGSLQRAELEDRLRQDNVLAQVEFLGGVDHAALLDWYRRADICVVPSLLYESFSYTCAQAMAAGKPIVASRIGGIPETVRNGVSGIIVEPGDVEQLAEAIVRLARDPSLREQLGRAGRERVVCEFDPIKVAQRNLEGYEQAKRAYERSNR